MTLEPRALLLELFRTAVAAAGDMSDLPRHLPHAVTGRILVIGAGKASVAMADALTASRPEWFDSGQATGFVVAQDGQPPARRLETLHAAHPVPDARSEAAGRRALAEAERLGPDDLLIALISGGGSSLLVAPRPGVALEDKIAAGQALLRSGLPISTVNALRRRLSAIKGGGLARAAHPAKVLTFVVSDVPGDDPADVASGPTLAPGARSAPSVEALSQLPAGVRERFATQDADDRQAHGPVHILASSSTALDAAAAVARRKGLRVINLGGGIQGEARQVAEQHARIALDHSTRQTPTLILSGGETSVTVVGAGRGGRNSEYALALAIALHGAPGIHALAADTDGLDGNTPAAGAIVRPSTLADAKAQGFNPQGALERNDTYPLFEALGDSATTGPTGVNVNDFRAILVG
jgi:hydroxypyruvate reductase